MRHLTARDQRKTDNVSLATHLHLYVQHHRYVHGDRRDIGICAEHLTGVHAQPRSIVTLVCASRQQTLHHLFIPISPATIIFVGTTSLVCAQRVTNDYYSAEVIPLVIGLQG